MKFPVRIRKEMDEYVLDAVPAFTLSLNYKVLDAIRGSSIDAVIEQTQKLISETIHHFISQDAYFALPRNLSVYEKSNLRFVETDKTWATVDVDLADLVLPTQGVNVEVPVVIANKLYDMAHTVGSTPDMLLTVLLAQLQPEQYKKE